MLAALAVFAAFLCGFFFWIQIRNYDEGMLEIYANQQDAFVQLTLDQINLLGGHSEEKIISDILGTLDASSDRFWTLARNQAMIFVRDVAETNSYKGFDEKTYFVSDSAREFIDGLSVNRVAHRLIEQNEREYVASGTVFQYSGQEYVICLLTNRDVILDENLYLNAKINLHIMLLFFLALFVVSVVAATLRLDRFKREKAVTEQDNRILRTMAERLNNRLEKKELYDTSLAVFDKELLGDFLDRLKKKKAYPCTLVMVSFRSARERKLFLQASQLTMKQDVVRFSEGGNQLIFVGLRTDGASLVRRMEALFPGGMKVDEIIDAGSEADHGKLVEFLKRTA